jgi:hypothetical protein
VMCTSRCSSSRNREPGVNHSQHIETYQVWCPRNPGGSISMGRFLAIVAALVLLALHWLVWR